MIDSQTPHVRAVGLEGPVVTFLNATPSFMGQAMRLALGRDCTAAAATAAMASELRSASWRSKSWQLELMARVSCVHHMNKRN